MSTVGADRQTGPDAGTGADSNNQANVFGLIHEVSKIVKVRSAQIGCLVADLRFQAQHRYVEDGMTTQECADELRYGPNLGVSGPCGRSRGANRHRAN
jgi:hypothetical protein